MFNSAKTPKRVYTSSRLLKMRLCGKKKMDRLLTTIGRLLIAVFWLVGLIISGTGAVSLYGHYIGDLGDAMFDTTKGSLVAIGFGLAIGIGMHLLMKWIWIKK